MSRAVLFVLVPLALILTTLYMVGVESLPVRNGDIVIQGINATVQVNYDEWAVPTINAMNDADAFFAIGFLHAQNRLWQMEMNRRRASGTLSEILGESAVQNDVLMRTFGLGRNAERVLAGLPPDDLEVLTAYVEGVNKGIEKLKRLPPEYTILNFEPKPWTELDSLLWQQLITLRMESGLASELQNALILRSFDDEVAAELLSGEAAVEKGEYGSIKNFDVNSIFSSVSANHLYPKPFVGSNAWAVSGEHTESGSPVLANDPHLENSLPSVFYLARINGDRLKVSGATFPGLPFVVAGTNGNIAWGVTVMRADTQDIYVERPNPLNPNQYELDGGYVDMEVYSELIQVKNKFLKSPKPEPDLKITVRRTHRGPVLSDLFPAMGGLFSLRWTGDDEDGGTFSSFLKVNYAANSQEFIDALSSYVAPILNFVYVDKNGDIGNIAPGKYPVRSDIHGILPTPGWLSENDWHGWIPREKWPQQSNPEGGVVVAANHDWIEEDYPYYISRNWASNYRSSRISKLIGEGIERTDGRLSVKEFAIVQADIKHPLHNILLEYIEDMEKQQRSSAVRRALELIKEWDGVMRSDSAEAAIVTSWMANLTELVFEDDIKRKNLPRYLFDGFLDFENSERMEKVLAGSFPSLCEYTYEDIYRDCREVVMLALEHALLELEEEMGNDADRWAWEELATTAFVHFPFSAPEYTGLDITRENKLLSRIFHREIPGSGTTESINARAVSLNVSSRYQQLYGDTYRQIIDLGRPEKSVFLLSTGQSGNVFSKHYDDMIELFGDGSYIQMKAMGQKNEFRLIPVKD